MRVSGLTSFGFALPGFFMALTAIPTYITLQRFYVVDLGLAAGLVAWVIFWARMLDAVTDPLIGWLSDRLNTPLGRRKPLIFWVGSCVWSPFGPYCSPADNRRVKSVPPIYFYGCRSFI